MKTLQYDAIVIGFGKGGKTLAARLAAEGKEIALIEKDATMYGGTCINIGCIPSKSLIFSASKVNTSLPYEKKAAIYKDAIEEKRRLTAMLRQKNYEKLASLPNITIYNGTAKFTAPQKIEVSFSEDVFGKNGITKNPLSLSAHHIFINTGSVSKIPPIDGINTASGIYTSTELMELNTLPKHLVIIGGGYIGLEFASMYSGFGSKVTILQHGETFLPREDRDIAEAIKSMLQERGVEFFFGAETKKIETSLDTDIKTGQSEHSTVTILHQEKTKELSADAVLVATGRAPNTAGLNCEAAGIELTPQGAVHVDEYLHTSAANVWAIGDVAGGLQHTYISLDDSRIIGSQLFGGKIYKASERKNVPYSVFLATPYSRVGINETEARQGGHNIKVLTMPAAAIPKAQVLRATTGTLKAIIDVNTNKILGAMLLCEESYEMINVIKLVMDMNADYKVLRDQIFTHPTMSEALNDLFTL